MKLQEYQSKLLFNKFGVPIPEGRVTNTASEVKQIAQDLGGRVVVKAQVLVGGRGKAGGIRLAKTPEEAQDLATMILARDLKGLPVRKVLVDEAVSFTKELYLAVSSDRNIKQPIVMASSSGGMDIEEVAQKNPGKIIRVAVDPFLGLREFQARDLAIGIDLPRELWKEFTDIALGLWQAYLYCDASLAEINPLVVTKEGRLLALDGKMILDDNALFRHPDLVDMRDLDSEAPEEIEARKYGLTYIKLDGEIGCLVNGAGLAMATMDIIKLCEGSPANFLDIGGGAGAEKVAAAFRIITSDTNVKAILVNIFGGITRCDEVAHGILTALSDLKLKLPLVVRLVGTNARQGLEILSNANLTACETLEKAAKTAVQMAKG